MAMVFSVWLTALTPGTPVNVCTTTLVGSRGSCSIASWSLMPDREMAGTTWNTVLSWPNVVRLIVPAASRSALLTTTVTTPRNVRGVVVRS